MPALRRALGLEDEDVQLLFGPRCPATASSARSGIDWMNRLFVPLAQAYLHAAVDDVEPDERNR